MKRLLTICTTIFFFIIILLASNISFNKQAEEKKYKYSTSPVKGVWRCENASYNDILYFMSDGRYRHIASYEDEGCEYLIHDHIGEFILSNDTLTLDEKQQFIIFFEDNKLHMYSNCKVLIYSNLRGIERY